MTPRVYLVRHGQGEHNVINDWDIRDPTLTPKGKQQCFSLRDSFRHHETIDLVVTSPLRRALQTTVLGFSPLLDRSNVPVLALPLVQEVGDAGCDTGLEPCELKSCLPDLFSEEKIDFRTASRINFDEVSSGWNVKSGYWAYEREACSKRASDFRTWLWQRPEKKILVVSHGVFLHFLAEDVDVDDPMETTAYKNCEVREFVFSATSSAQDAHLEETSGSKAMRDENVKEKDPHVMKELEDLSSDANSRVITPTQRPHSFKM